MACRRLNPDDEDSLVAGSQFFITLADKIDYLDGKHAPFGHVVEGNEEGGALDKINEAFVDKDMRPMRDIRLQHVVVLDDPFEDPDGLVVPSRTPSPTPEQLKPIGLDASEVLDDADDSRPPEEVEEERRKRDTNAAALTLEMVGDLPFAEVRPPENILFVCKLNPVTRSEDLELIFSRFGKIMSCEVIKDKKTGDSLQYAFIEFDKQESAEQAYFKMQNVLVDDRRIWVDFSQSVSKLSSSWNQSRAGGKPVRVMHGKGASSTSPFATRDMVFDFDEKQSSSRRRDDGFRGAPQREADRYARDRGGRRDYHYGASTGHRGRDESDRERIRGHRDVDGGRARQRSDAYRQREGDSFRHRDHYSRAERDDYDRHREQDRTHRNHTERHLHRRRDDRQHSPVAREQRRDRGPRY